MDRWDNLNMQQKAQLLGIYASKGYTDLASIINHYNTFQAGGRLTFNEWKSQMQSKYPDIEMDNTKAGYDYVRYFNDNYDDAIRQLSELRHFPDTYKLPNHKTFSNESIYSRSPMMGGNWINDSTFYPSIINRQQYPDIYKEDRPYTEREIYGNEYQLGGILNKIRSYFAPTYGGSFNQAYATAVKNDDEYFKWNGNRYNTKDSGIKRKPSQTMPDYSQLPFKEAYKKASKELPVKGEFGWNGAVYSANNAMENTDLTKIPVYKLWETVTGQPWSKAKEWGFTDGLAKTNIGLRKALLQAAKQCRKIENATPVEILRVLKNGYISTDIDNGFNVPLNETPITIKDSKAGKNQGTIFFPTVLDSLAVHGFNTNTSPVITFGLPAQESAMSPLYGHQTTDAEDFNNFAVGQMFSAWNVKTTPLDDLWKYVSDAKNDSEANMTIKNGAPYSFKKYADYILPSNIIDWSYNKFKSGTYNTGDENHTRDVIKRGTDFLQANEVQNWFYNHWLPEQSNQQEWIDWWNNYQQGGSLGKVTPYGQWEYPHQITTIPSNNITMKGVNYPVVGVSNTGDTKYMLPNMDYLFDGQYVTEYPLHKFRKGGYTTNGRTLADGRTLYPISDLPAEDTPTSLPAARIALKPVTVTAKHPYHDIWGEENPVPADLNTPEKWQDYKNFVTNVQERPDYKGVQTFMNVAALSPLLPILGPEALSFGKEALLGTAKAYAKPMATAMLGLAGYEGLNNLSLEGTGNTFDYNLARNIVHSEPTSGDILAASFLNPGWYFGGIEETAAKGVNSALKSFELPFLTQRTPNTLTRVIGSGTTGLEDAVIKAGYIRGNPNGGITTAKNLNRRYLPKLKQAGASQGLYDRFASNALTEKDYEWLHKNMPEYWFVNNAPVEEGVISLNRGILPQTYEEYLQKYRSNNPQRTNIDIRTGEGLTSEDIAYNWAGENEPTFAVSKDIAKEMGYDYENILNNSLFRGDYAVQIKNARTHGVSGNNFPTGAHLDEHWSLKYPIEWNNPDVSFYKAHKIPFTKKKFYTKINPLKELGIEQAYQEGMNTKVQGSSIWQPASEEAQKTYDFLAKPILGQIADPSSSFKIPNTLYQSGVDYIERGISPEVRNIVETQVKPRLLTEDTRFYLAGRDPSYARDFNNAIDETVKSTEVSEWSKGMMEDYNRVNNVNWGGFSLNDKPRVILGKNSSMPVSTTETHELRHQLQKSIPRTPTEQDILKEAYSDAPQPRKGDGSIDASYDMSQEWETMNTEARKILLEKAGYKYDATKSLEENVIEQDRILENYKNSDLVQTLHDEADGYWRRFIDEFQSKTTEEKRAKVAAWKKAMRLVGASTGIVGTGALSHKQ